MILMLFIGVLFGMTIEISVNYRAEDILPAQFAMTGKHNEIAAKAFSNFPISAIMKMLTGIQLCLY